MKFLPGTTSPDTDYHSAKTIYRNHQSLRGFKSFPGPISAHNMLPGFCAFWVSTVCFLFYISFLWFKSLLAKAHNTNLRWELRCLFLSDNYRERDTYTQDLVWSLFPHQTRKSVEISLMFCCCQFLHCTLTIAM